VRIRTTCGKEFEMEACDMEDWQLKALIERNKDRTDISPAELEALQEELWLRRWRVPDQEAE
jgi:hypothetical protein